VSQTEEQYREILSNCQDIFEKKTKDYGTAWRILRLPSLTDQIYIKAQRIRSIQDKGTQKIDEGIAGEFIAIVNYCIMALIQMELHNNTDLELDPSIAVSLYNQKAEATLQLLLAKNHDYGEAWREMRVSSITDIILMKIYRTKQIEDNQGETIISEGVDANYMDMLNYSVFCLIKMSEIEK